MLREFAFAVVEQDLSRCHVVTDCNIQVAIPIQVSQFTRISCRAIRSKGTHDCKAGESLIEKQEILLRPVPSVRDDGVQIAIAIDVP